MSLLPVWLRRELGLKVNGPKPGFKHPKARVANTVPIWSATHVPLDLRGSLEDVSMLPPMSGLMVRESVLNARYKNWGTAVASIRPMCKGGKLSIRKVISRGANDVLILRTR